MSLSKLSSLTESSTSVFQKYPFCQFWCQNGRNLRAFLRFCFVLEYWHFATRHHHDPAALSFTEVSVHLKPLSLLFPEPLHSQSVAGVNFMWFYFPVTVSPGVNFYVILCHLFPSHSVTGLNFMWFYFPNNSHSKKWVAIRKRSTVRAPLWASSFMWSYSQMIPVKKIICWQFNWKSASIQYLYFIKWWSNFKDLL